MKTKLTPRQVQQFHESVIHNFGLSVVMPFYKRLPQFTNVIKINARYFQRNGIEVIIVMDEPTEKDGVIELIKQYPFINWKVIINEQDHQPRNPAKVINVGIRHATKKYVLVTDPEKEFFTDVILQMREILENYPKHYAVGTLTFVEENEIVTNENINRFNFMDYGGLMLEKKYLEQLNGYDETFLTWGGEDDDILRRLDLIGVKKLVVEEAKSLHRETKAELARRPVKGLFFSGKQLKKFFYADKAIVNDDNWGTDFNKIIYDWENNIYAEELCRKYLDGFVKYEIRDSRIFQNKYQKLILCQAWNESEYMTGFLEDMAKYFDGIILLDDGSTDDTWELANHEKLLLKVKKVRTEFNDLQNRNMLLDIASFFKSEWFCFMDIDERFDERYVGFLDDCKNKKCNVLAFNRVVLWEPEKYNTEILDYASIKGIMLRMRMFRNIGHSQIITLNSKLHFTPVPIHRILKISKTLIIDFGLANTKRRKAKFKLYKKEDIEAFPFKYNYLLKRSSELNEINKIDLEKTRIGLPPKPGLYIAKLHLNAVAGKDNEIPI
jgi:glycosyltransferase involved in cell wall biosynthesis